MTTWERLAKVQAEIHAIREDARTAQFKPEPMRAYNAVAAVDENQTIDARFNTLEAECGRLVADLHWLETGEV
jgi:hypothetical protein